MPRQNTGRFAFLDTLYHLAEHGAARYFGGLLFDKNVNDFDLFFPRQLPQFRELVRNTPHLTAFVVRGLAGVDEKLSRHTLNGITSKFALANEESGESL